MAHHDPRAPDPLRTPTAARPNPRWAVAEAVTAAILRRYRADVQAIGVHGSLAHGDDTEGSNVDLVVVTHRPGTGPRPTSRRVDGVIVDCGVISAAEYLSHAETLSTGWPLMADQYVTTWPVYDPDGWHDRLRDAHLGRLASAGHAEFAVLAREAWGTARSTADRAMRLALGYDTDGAVLTLGAARVATALVEGLLGRTYFRGEVDAVRRTGTGTAGLVELDLRLRVLAVELARRAAPVDATPDEIADTG